MIKELLAQHEGKTLEFKENSRPTQKILRTAVAFANTAGGTLLIGVRDGTKEVLGVKDSLRDEERIASIFADGIRPLLACSEINSEAIDFRAASEFFSQVSRKLNPSARRSLGLFVHHAGREFPSRGAVLLFGKSRRTVFPDAIIRCARFKGSDSAHFIDKIEIDEYLPQAIESTLAKAARFWKTSDRTARTRLRKLVSGGLLAEIGTGPKDPRKVYVLKRMSGA